MPSKKTTSPRPDPFRPATLEDLPFIEDLLAEFWAKQGHVYGVLYDPVSTVRSVQETMETGICLVGPSSTFGAIFHPFWLNRNVVVAYVLFWYFRKPREIRIFEKGLDILRRTGVDLVTATSHDPDHRIRRYYKKLGMRPVEGHSMLNLT